ncbi:MAG: cytochrome-c peroxidase [Chitinophagales bacterium]|nr:cytochrome-c peroxidase [Chitinophagales bacterium]
MKRLMYILSAAIIVLAACNNQTKTGEEAKVINPSDKELLERAQAIFQTLPATAENPNNPITPQKVELGKVLYHDTRLSKTGNNSCNSCHNLSTFGVDNLPTSEGDEKKFGDRNSPTVLNAALHSFQFWDGRAKDVEEQAGMPITNPIEMAIPDKPFLVNKLKGIKEYQEMFKAAFPNDKDPLTYNNIQNAIAAFERTLITPSAFDTYLKGDVHALNTDEREGLQQFIDVGCIQCHTGSNLGGTMFQKFGVYADYRTFYKTKVDDTGKKMVTGQESDKDMFKVPGLRNVVKTYPYFHDGGVADLKEAIRIMGKAQLNKDLSDAQINSLVTFLNTLTADIPESAKKVPEILAQQ